MTYDNYELVKAYYNNGFMPIPIEHKSKSPKIKGWQKIKRDAATVKRLFKEGKLKTNIGLILGETSRGLVDIDLDDEIAVKLAPYFLPKTNMIFGRASKPKSHYMYISEGAKTKQFQAGTMLIELRSNPCQTVVPGSVHTSGEAIEFTYPDWQPSIVDLELLLKSVKLIAAATLLVKNYPQEGTRNNAWLPLISILFKTGTYTVEEIEHFVRVCAEQAGDEEAESRVRIIIDTENKINNNLPTQGVPSLKEYFNDDFIKYFCKFIDYKSETGLAKVSNVENSSFTEYFNSKYALIILGGKEAILKEKLDEPIPYEFISLNAFHTYYKHMHTQHKGVTYYHSKLWLMDPERRAYEGIEFAIKNPRPNYYNMWKGLSVQPIEGDWSKFKEHILNNICNANQEYYKYLITWMAYAAQHPEKKIGTAIALKGKQGTGKSIFAKIFGSLFGIHYKVVSNPRYITGNFNSQLANCIILHAEEGFFAGDKVSEGILKELITGDKQIIEYKGKEPIEVANYIKFIVTSNNDWVVPAGERERRFFVLEVSDRRIQDKPYFEAIQSEIDNGGLEAMLYDLLNYDLSGINLRQIPYTESLLEQKFASFDSMQKWLLDLYAVGELPGQNGWSGICGVSSIYNSYIDHSGKVGARFNSTSTQLGIFLRKYVPGIDKPRGAYTSYDEMGSMQKTGSYYIFPSLEECRKAFEAKVGQAIDWSQL